MSPMMEETLPQQLMNTVNGSFALTVLLQKRVRQLVLAKERPLFETRERNPIRIAFEEWKRGLINLVPDEGVDLLGS